MKRTYKSNQLGRDMNDTFGNSIYAVYPDVYDYRISDLDDLQEEVNGYTDHIWDQIKNVQKEFDAIDISSRNVIKKVKEVTNSAIKRIDALLRQEKNRYGKSYASLAKTSISVTKPLYTLDKLADRMDHWYEFVERMEQRIQDEKHALIELIQKEKDSIAGIDRVMNKAEQLQNEINFAIWTIETYNAPEDDKTIYTAYKLSGAPEQFNPPISLKLTKSTGSSFEEEISHYRPTNEEIDNFSDGPVTKLAVIIRLSRETAILQTVYKRCSILKIRQKTISGFRKEMEKEIEVLERGKKVAKCLLIELKGQAKETREKEKREALLQQVEKQEQIQQTRYQMAYKSWMVNCDDTIYYFDESHPLYFLLTKDLEQKIDLELLEELKEILSSFQELKKELSTEPEEKKIETNSSSMLPQPTTVPIARAALNQVVKEAEEIIKKIATKIESGGKVRERFELAKKEVKSMKELLIGTEKIKKFSIVELPEAEQKFKKAREELITFLNIKGIHMSMTFDEDRERMERKTIRAKNELENLKEDIIEMDVMFEDFQENLKEHCAWLKEMEEKLLPREQSTSKKEQTKGEEGKIKNKEKQEEKTTTNAKNKEEVKGKEEEKMLTNPTGKGIRNDSGGQGHFGAPRRSRKHEGLDFSTTVGQDIVAPLSGKVRNLIGTTTGYPMLQIYPKKVWTEFDYLEILYVDIPSGIKMGDFRQVLAGDPVGIAMNLQDPRLKYPTNVTPHVHLQLKKTVPGKEKPVNIDPTEFFHNE